MPGINRDGLHSGKPRLVFNESPKLKERPTRHLCPLSPAKPCSIADAFEVFNGDSRVRAFCFLNQLFADDVVGVSAESPLFLRGGFQLTTDALWSIAALFALRRGFLKRPSSTVVLLACFLYFGAAEGFAIAIGRQIDYPEIHTDKVGGWRLRSIGQINSHEKKPFAVFPAYKIGLTVFQMEAFLLIFAHDKWNDDPAFERQQADSIRRLEAHQSLIVWDARVFLESRLPTPVAAESLTNLGNTADCHLSGESEIFAQLTVVELLKLDLVRGLQLEGFASQPIGGGIEGFHRGRKHLGLPLIR